MNDFPLPAWIDREAWIGFVEMRKTVKKPLTFRAAKMILTELAKLKAAGHDANAALDQSTNHCWADVYPVKAKDIPVLAVAQADEELQRIRAQAERATKPPPEVLAKLRGVLRA